MLLSHIVCTFFLPPLRLRLTLFPTRRSSDLRHWPRRPRLPAGFAAPYRDAPSAGRAVRPYRPWEAEGAAFPHLARRRSEEHTSELQSPCNLVCRLLLEENKDQSQTQKLRELH